MIDLHTHTLFSDGELIPSELVRRAADHGYRAIALTDHADHSNYDFIIPRVVRVCAALSSVVPVRVIPGIELTHVHPSLIKELSDESRALGAKLIVAHGETIIEPVLPGTNRAALDAGVDILAHPGLVTEEEAFMAAERGILLEVTVRKGHSLANGHVVSVARRCGAGLILNTDTHGPGDLVTRDTAHRIAAGAGMSKEEIDRMFLNAERLCEAAGTR